MIGVTYKILHNFDNAVKNMIYNMVSYHKDIHSLIQSIIV